MTTIIKYKNIVSILTLTLLLSFTIHLYPALANDLQPIPGSNFEVGTLIGITHITSDDVDFDSSITLTHIPTSFGYVGASPTSLYFTWFPSSHIAIGPEFSYGRLTVTNTYFGETESSSITSLYLGGRVSVSLLEHTVSTPYIYGRASYTILDDEGDSENITSSGIGIGYRWRLGTSFVLRTETQFQLITIDDETNNEFALIIGIGTRFGK